MITYSWPSENRESVRVRKARGFITVDWPEKKGRFGIDFSKGADLRKVYDCVVANLEWRKSEWKPSFEEWQELVR